jgi:citronellol/citronellal dehydrogenase
LFINTLFDGKQALITGGATGIGFEIASKFKSYGGLPIIASRKEEKLKSAAKQLDCPYFVCDIREPDQILSLVEKMKSSNLNPDFLINNAGGQFPSLAEDISNNGWNAVINTNLNGHFFMTKEIANAFFIPSKKGKIINIIANIFRGFPGMAHTGAARAGMDNLTKSLAVEWSKHQININAIAPGIIKSSGLDQYPTELLKGISDTIPLKRLGTTEEVAWLCLFLLSPMATYITGETIYLDGGQKLWGQIFEL